VPLVGRQRKPHTSPAQISVLPSPTSTVFTRRCHPLAFTSVSPIFDQRRSRDPARRRSSKTSGKLGHHTRGEARVEYKAAQTGPVVWSIKTPEQTPEQNDYAAKLYARLGEAVVLRRMEVEVGGWQPLANECHANATQVHLRDASYTPVRGWLYFDFGSYLDHVQFLAHSVVRAPNG